MKVPDRFFSATRVASVSEDVVERSGVAGETSQASGSIGFWLASPAGTCYICIDQKLSAFIPSKLRLSSRKGTGIKSVLRRLILRGLGSGDVLEPEDKIRFEQLVLPHLDSAANLARWLLRNQADADDVVQEAVLRAFRFFNRFHGGDARAWLLQIVRNTCYTWLGKNRPAELMTEFNEEVHQRPSANPETLAAQADERQRLMLALESLPPRSREVLILRELEGCSYKEIGEITGIPLGTVMSTLSRARERLQQTLAAAAAKEAS
ncbi:MAG: sigma-70 family RNA polymerase sigma factor [Acidobacteria bacterium]|nr:sigma-70 family RNA polymerase sigma factor [Acidobacteriota bacterium]